MSNLTAFEKYKLIIELFQTYANILERQRGQGEEVFSIWQRLWCVAVWSVCLEVTRFTHIFYGWPDLLYMA